MADAFQYDVFLSHSAKDKAVVRLLAERLRKDGVKVWFDEWVLKPGDSIPAKIEEGLEHSRVLVLCMSANAFGSDWAQLEAGTFRFRDPLNKEHRFIPLRLDDAPIKGSLAQFLYINWHSSRREQEYSKLLGSCRPPADQLVMPQRVVVAPKIAKGLLVLKQRIMYAKIPSSKRDERINIAIWNIREFGRKPRTEAALHYIAEIIRQFDLVALVEMRNTSEDLTRMVEILGPSWKFFLSDRTDEKSGNDECTAFVYDSRSTTRYSLASEIAAPDVRQGDERATPPSSWRPPYVCSFRSGRFDFLVVRMHFPESYSETAPQGESRFLTDWIKRLFQSKVLETHDIIVLGDFHNQKPASKKISFLDACGLKVSSVFKDFRIDDGFIEVSKSDKNLRYHRILHCPVYPQSFTNAGGILDFYIDDAHIKELFPEKKFTRKDFTCQLSNQFPMWMQINTDIEGFRLNEIVQDNNKS